VIKCTHHFATTATANPNKVGAASDEHYLMFRIIADSTPHASISLCCRLRLAIIKAEFIPVSIIMGHRKVHTIAQNTRLPSVCG